MTINKQAQYESKFSRLWERYDEASHGNSDQMRDILELTLDTLESAERQILRLEKLAEAESVGADKAATSGVEWMKRYHAAEKRIAELEAREVKLPELKMLRDYLAEVTMREREDIMVGVRLEFFRALKESGVKVSAAAGKGEPS